MASRYVCASGLCVICFLRLTHVLTFLCAGESYLNGTGGDKDEKKAALCHALAAGEGYPESSQPKPELLANADPEALVAMLVTESAASPADSKSAL